MTPIFYYPTARRRELFGFVPDNWLWAGELLRRPGDMQSFPIHPLMPVTPISMEEVPTATVSSFTIRYETDRDGRDNFTRIPIFVLISGGTGLVDHPRVATFPDARIWVRKTNESG